MGALGPVFQMSWALLGPSWRPLGRSWDGLGGCGEDGVLRDMMGLGCVFLLGDGDGGLLEDTAVLLVSENWLKA